MLRSNRANRWRTFLRGFVCVLWTAALAGCLAFAVPTREHTPKGFPTRGMIKDDSFAFVEPGSTNRQEILLRLGEPDAASADETIFVYRWRTVHGLWRWCADAGRPTRFKPSSPSPPDAVRDGSAKLGHPVQNVTREHGLTPLPR